MQIMRDVSSDVQYIEKVYNFFSIDIVPNFNIFIGHINIYCIVNILQQLLIY